ncbi:MAG: glycosyltransferase family 4 protein [Actinobacteria bacterium]|nr:glycosyltransferase family 4 protein [Actinomycetota bacterium]
MSTDGRARILVMTVVHDPRDARIFQREIRALTTAGDRVTFAAPFSDYGVQTPSGIDTVDLPRAVGRRRTAALREARSALRRLAPHHDVVVLHDPELLVAAVGLDHPLVVWDVHEDTAAALSLKAWLPEQLRPLVRSGVSTLEHRAERTHRLLLAESDYAERFEFPHPVVPNTSPVPPDVPAPDARRAVYLGRVSVERGGLDLIEVGRRIHQSAELVVIGPADSATAEPLAAAHSAGWIRYEGFVDNDQALDLIEGSGVGLSLLHDQPNYRHSMPTKVVEYMARGIPVVTTPLPRARSLVEEAASGVIVPFNDPAAAADAVLGLLNDDERRRQMGAAGHEHVRAHANWDVDGPAFVALLHRWIGEANRTAR